MQLKHDERASRIDFRVVAHTIGEKKKLLNRVRRIMGQVAAVEKSLNEKNADCPEILHNISACRGVMERQQKVIRGILAVAGKAKWKSWN